MNFNLKTIEFKAGKIGRAMAQVWTRMAQSV